jgi:hypothetical protein
VVPGERGWGGITPFDVGRLREAVRANRHVPKCLTGKVGWPGSLPEPYAFGSEEETVLCAHKLGVAWRATPSAKRWLAA